MAPPTPKARNRIIIDTDPGVDDVLALLFALAAPASELEILLISVTFGNVDVRACLRNVVALFGVVEQELQSRRAQGSRSGDLGFEAARTYKPIVAVGAHEPLQQNAAVAGEGGSKGGATENADYFHGRDGLAGIHTSHPKFSPEKDWEKMFKEPADRKTETVISKTASNEADLTTPTKLVQFTPSREPAHKEMLRLLRENEPDTITIISIGPLTNCALAAAEDPETFLRCKELVTMGGAVKAPGNVTPVAEFNVYADAYSAARIYALTSQIPHSTMPPPSARGSSLKIPEYPAKLSRRLNLTLMSLDITEEHVLTRGQFRKAVEPLASQNSPLASWMTAFLTPMLDKMEMLATGSQAAGGDLTSLALHDPMCVWYVLTQPSPEWRTERGGDGELEDIRVDMLGQWTRGMTVGDRRPRQRRNSDGEVPHDRGNWLGRVSGNRIRRLVGSPGVEQCAVDMLQSLLGGS